MSDLLVHLLKIGGVFSFMLLLVSYTVWAERRIAAWMQDRVGPNRVGFAGLLQPIADGIKLILKEDVIPNHVNKVYYVLAPVVVMIPALVTAAVIPWGSFLGSMRCVIADLDAGILFVFAIASLGVYGIVLAGWASNSKYPFLGGVRSSAQMISYEVCISLSVVPVFLQAGTLHLGSVIEYQTQHGWLILYQPLSFLFFLISSFAETNRLPFDLPEAEQELVSGYHTEYSSMKFGLFFMGEYANMIVASSLMVTLFLGGWSLPFGPLNAPAGALWVGVLHVLIFLVKVCLLLFVFIWVRWTLPRFRYDQLMAIGWKVFLPLTIVNIVICAALAGLGVLP